jgi:hypothetical protein
VQYRALGKSREKPKRDLQDIEWLAIESLPSYREGRQHMISAINFAVVFGLTLSVNAVHCREFCKAWHLFIINH